MLKKSVLYKIIIILVFIIIIGIAGIYFYQSQTVDKGFYNGKITIGANIWPGYVGLFAADTKGYFKDEGLNVEIKLYENLDEVGADYIDGKMQGRTNITLESIGETLNGFDQKIVSIIDYSNGADAIISKNSIQNIDELQGKRVAYDQGTLEEFFLAFALKRVNLSIDDVVSIDADPEIAAAMLDRGEVDVAVTYDPFMTEALNSGSNQILFSSADAPGVVTDVLTFRSDFINQYPKTIQAFLRAYFKGFDFVKQNPTEAYAILGQKFGVSSAEIETQLRGIKVLSKEENRQAFAPGFNANSLYLHLEEIGSFIGNHRARAEHIYTDTLIDPVFINNFFLENQIE